MKYNSIRGCGYWARFADADKDLADADTTIRGARTVISWQYGCDYTYVIYLLFTFISFCFVVNAVIRPAVC
jgi:hypothetical protein